MTGMYSKFSFIAVLLALAPGTNALADDAGGAYLGADFGRARNGYDTNFIDRQVATAAANADQTVSYSAQSTQRMSYAWSGHVGYLFNPSVGIEAGFLHLGEIRYVAVGELASALGNRALSTRTEVTSHGPTLSAIYRLPLTENFAFDIRLGDYFGKTSLDYTITVDSKDSSVAVSKSASSLLLGAGASYTLAGHWSGRLAYLRVHNTGDGATNGRFSVNLFTAGLSYTF